MLFYIKFPIRGAIDRFSSLKGGGVELRHFEHKVAWNSAITLIVNIDLNIFNRSKMVWGQS